jgi:hypothetical protein
MELVLVEAVEDVFNFDVDFIDILDSWVDFIMGGTLVLFIFIWVFCVGF